jgi:hypothetical protein
VLAVAALVVVLPAAAGALSQGASAAAANSRTYNDSTGENPAAPDITTIVVSNTDAGMVSFKVNVPNRAQLGQDMFAVLYVDTDANVQTGSPDDGGADYAIELFRGEVQLYKWDGTGFTRRFGDPPSITLSYGYQAGVTFRISASELGNTKRLNFYVIVVSGVTYDPTTGEPDFTNAVADVAPAGNLFPYQVITAKPTLVVRRLFTSPKLPTAGKQFSLKVTAARSDTNAVIRNGRVTCVGRVGKAPLRARVARVVSGAVTCTWLIPKNAKGKRFRGTATVVFEGLRATRSFTARIR